MKKTSRHIAQASARHAINDWLIAAAQAMDTLLPNVLDDGDIECLHQFRIQLRKTRSLVKEFAKPLRQPLWQSEMEFFKSLGKLTAEVRDLDVYLVQAAVWQSQLSEEDQTLLAPFVTLLQSKRADVFGELTDYLRDAEYQNHRDAWAAVLQTIDHSTPSRIPLAKVAGQRLSKRMDALLKAGAGLTEASPDEAFHQLRLDFKRMRYLLEYFRAVFDNKTYRRLLKSVKQMQTVLGEFQDITVQKQRLMELSDELAQNARVSHRTFILLGAIRERLTGDHDGLKHQFLTAFATLRKNNPVTFPKALKSRPLKL